MRFFFNIILFIVFSFDLCFVNLCSASFAFFIIFFFCISENIFCIHLKAHTLPHTQTHKARKHTLRALLRDNTYTQHAKLSATPTRKYVFNTLKSAFNIKGMALSEVTSEVKVIVPGQKKLRHLLVTVFNDDDSFWSQHVALKCASFSPTRSRSRWCIQHFSLLCRWKRLERLNNCEISSISKKIEVGKSTEKRILISHFYFCKNVFSEKHP